MRVIPPNRTSSSFMIQKVCVVVAGCLSYVLALLVGKVQKDI